MKTSMTMTPNEQNAANREQDARFLKLCQLNTVKPVCSDLSEGEAQHTPGPWEAADSDQYQQTVYIFESKNGRSLARTVQSLSPIEQRANARLIAAAPELLAALEKLLGALEIKNLVFTNQLSADECTLAADEARAAIATAKA